MDDLQPIKKPRCLYCHRKLRHHHPDEYYCQCGCRYSSELVDNANTTQWTLVRLFRIFKTVRDGNTVTLMFYQIKGHVVYPWMHKLWARWIDWHYRKLRNRVFKKGGGR